MLTLDEKFRIVVDASAQNFILEKLEDIKDKQSQEVVRQEWTFRGYHGGSIGSLLKQYSKEALIDDGGLESINDVLNKLNEINQTIAMVVKRENIKLDVKKDD